MKWEYKTTLFKFSECHVDLESNVPQLDQLVDKFGLYLSKCGEDGWELFELDKNFRHGCWLIVFKREKVADNINGEWCDLCNVVHYYHSPCKPNKCEHGVEDYEYCADCSREYKRAAKVNGQ